MDLNHTIKDIGGVVKRPAIEQYLKHIILFLSLTLFDISFKNHSSILPYPFIFWPVGAFLKNTAQISFPRVPCG